MNLDAKLTDPFSEPYPDEIEMGNKYRRAQANTPPGQNPQVMFEPLTCRKAIVHALTQNYQGEQDMDPVAKFGRGKLAAKFVAEQKPEIDADERSTIYALTAKLYSPLIVYQVWTALE